MDHTNALRSVTMEDVWGRQGPIDLRSISSFLNIAWQQAPDQLNLCKTVEMAMLRHEACL